MSTPVESATLILKLYELRREPVLREARQWFIKEFNPTSFEELARLVSGPRNDTARMVIGYWDMAASLVTAGAIDPDMFLAGNNEIVAAFAKIEPYLEQIRAASQIPEFARHMEGVVRRMPDASARMKHLRDQWAAAASSKSEPLTE